MLQRCISHRQTLYALVLVLASSLWSCSNELDKQVDKEARFIIFDDPTQLVPGSGSNPTFDLVTKESFNLGKSVRVTPSGKDGETKVEISLTGSKVVQLEHYHGLVLIAKIGSDPGLVSPNYVSVEMEDVTGGGSALLGKISSPLAGSIPLGRGWVKIPITPLPDETTSAIICNRDYKMVLSFFHEENDQNGQKVKTPITRNIYLEELWGVYRMWQDY